MRPEDIELLAAPTAVTVHGDLALVALSAPNLAVDGNRGGLHRVELTGGGSSPWTHGDQDSVPTISPDGQWVAFLRVHGPKGKQRPQLHVMPAGGGEARAVTSLPGGAGAPVWAPDSRRIAFCARVPEPGRYGTPLSDNDSEPVDAAAEAPRRITRFSYRLDNVGFVDDQPLQLFVVDALADEPEAKQLTTGNAEPGDPAWSTDGTHLYVPARHEWGVDDTLLTDLYVVPAEGGDPELVASVDGDVSKPVVLGDGTIVFVGDHTPADEHGRPQAEARNAGVWSVRPGQAPVRLTDEETVDVERGAGSPVPVPGGVLVAVRNRGAIELREVPVDGTVRTLSELPVLAGEQGQVRAFAAHNGRVVAVVSTPDTAGDVVVVDAGESRVLTDFSAPLRAAGLRPVVEIKAAAPDGYPTHGWLVLPEGEGPHPVLLHVHGGPFMYHGWGLFDEAQVYAAAGYAVVLANPRGSSGYGQAHGQAIVRAMGTVDVDDLLSVLDAALERPECDENRVGVMGGSYGGWMTGWLAAKHGDRFVAAWSERAVNAWDSFAGSSDIGWFFADGYCGYGAEARKAVSPLTYADDIHIPFAIVHSEHDWRCPIEQAQRMFVALKKNGVDTEMLIFPGEGHELTRSGRPRHRKQRFDAVLEWWSRHLPV